MLAEKPGTPVVHNKVAKVASESHKVEVLATTVITVIKAQEDKELLREEVNVLVDVA